MGGGPRVAWAEGLIVRKNPKTFRAPLKASANVVRKWDRAMHMMQILYRFDSNKEIFKKTRNAARKAVGSKHHFLCARQKHLTLRR